MLAVLVLFVFTGTFLAAAVAVSVAAMLQTQEPEQVQGGTPLLMEQAPSSSMPIWRQLLDHLDFTQVLKRRIEEAGLRWAVGRVTLTMLLFATLGFAASFNASWAPPGIGFALAWLCGSIPYWIIGHKRKRRMAAMQAQFPDALDSMARAMRAGHSLSGAVAMIGLETPAPLGPEFHKVAEEQRLGLPWNAALGNLAARVPTGEVRLFVAAFLVQTRTGGKLTEVLERLAETIREAGALRGEVRAISAQGRMTGIILTALPVLIMGAMLMTNPHYIGLLFSSPIGSVLVWCSAVCVVLGHLLIQRIVDIKAPQ